MNVLVYDHEDENFEMLFNLLHKQKDINCDFCSFIPVNKTYDLLITDNDHFNHCAYITNIPIVIIGNQNNNNDITNELSYINELSADFSINNENDIININNDYNHPINNNYIYIKPPIFTNNLVNIINKLKYNKQKNDVFVDKRPTIHLIDQRPQKIWFSFLLNPMNSQIKYLRQTLLYYENIININVINSVNLIISQLIAEDLLNNCTDDTLSFVINLCEDRTIVQFNNLNLQNYNLFCINSQINHMDFNDNKTIITWLA